MTVNPTSIDTHDHVCLVYEGSGDPLPALVPYIREGLLARERCIWVLGDLAREEVRQALVQGGVDVQRHVERGGLRLWTHHEWRRDDTQGPIGAAEVRWLVEQALRDGFTGVRFVIATGGAPDTDVDLTPEALHRREQGIDALFRQPLPMRMVCLYSASGLPPQLLEAGLRTHPRAIMRTPSGAHICANPFYASQPRGAGDDGQRVRWMLSELGHALEERSRLERARRVLDAQFDVTRVLAEAKSLREATPRILESVCSSIGWEVGAIWRVDDADHCVRCVDVHVAPGIRASRFAAHSRARAFPIGVGLPGRVWQTRGPVWIRDVVQDRNFPRAAIAEEDDLHGAFGFPIRFGGGITGVLEFFSRSQRAPDRDLLAVMDALGSQIGQFLGRLQAGDELRASEQELSDFFERAPVPLHCVGPDGIILRVNQAELDLMGYTRAAYVGRHIAEFHVHSDVIGSILRRLAVGETLVAEPVQLRRKDGAVIDALIDSNAQFDDQGRFVLTRCFTRDVTARQRAEMALREREGSLRELTASLERKVAERTADLQATNDQLVEFSHTVSHDLKRPVRAIRGYADALREDAVGQLDAAGRAHLENIVASAGRMDALIRDMLTYSRMSRIELSQEPVDIDTALDLALVELKEEIAETHADVTRVSGPARTVAGGHHAAVVMALSNLISNAVKFVSPGVTPRVQVRIGTSGDRVRVVVSDNGIGIPPEHRERIFRVFERLHTEGRYPGSGVGLAMVRKAMDRMDGSVGVEEAPGGGCQFTLELPVHAPPEHAAAEMPAQPSAASAVDALLRGDGTSAGAGAPEATAAS